jgi:chitin synthase
LVAPATMGYLVYLIYTAVQAKNNFPVISLIMIGAAYGLQLIIVLLKRQWQHIGWLVIYILALPFFTFWLPIYAFWHMDDFSWGNTRVVIGEKGGKKHVVDEEPFDPNSIPMKKWSEYEQEMWEKESQGSHVSHESYATEYTHKTGYTNGSYAAPPMAMPMQAAPAYEPYPNYNNSRPMSMASGSPVPMSVMQSSPSSRPVSIVPSEQNGLYPTETQITNQIRSILATANLMSVTKKQVRDELSLFFGVDLTPRKDFINKVIEDILQGRM